jgi:hypothetical protein
VSAGALTGSTIPWYERVNEGAGLLNSALPFFYL